jgi:hypothetical protein
VSENGQQSARAQVELQPADMPGILRLSGTVQLPSYRSLLRSAADNKAKSQDQVKQQFGGYEVDANVTLRDGGMALLCAMVPGCEWQGGAVQVDLNVAGPALSPKVQGKARVARGMLSANVLRHPVTNISANLQVSPPNLPSWNQSVHLPLRPVLAARSLMALSWSSRGWRPRLGGWG